MNNIIIHSNNLSKHTKYQNYFNWKGFHPFLSSFEEMRSLYIIALPNVIFMQFTKNFHLASSKTSYAFAA